MNLSTINAAANYRLGNWRDKALGSKPTNELLATAQMLGLRAGKQALALAMALRPEGASAFQQVDACTLVYGESGTHNNVRRKLVSQGYLREVPTPHDAAGHKVYRVELTAKGKQRVDANLKKAATATAASEAAPKAKRTRTTKAAQKPASEAPKANAGASSGGLTPQQVNDAAAAQISAAADGQG